MVSDQTEGWGQGQGRLDAQAQAQTQAQVLMGYLNRVGWSAKSLVGHPNSSLAIQGPIQLSCHRPVDTGYNIREGTIIRFLIRRNIFTFEIQSKM